MNLEDNWLYEDGQDEIVFSVDTHCQLLGAGLCGTESYITAELELTEASTSLPLPVVALHLIGKPCGLVHKNWSLEASARPTWP